MLDTQFYKGFGFYEYYYTRYRTNDYTEGTGVGKHFFGRIINGKARITVDDHSLCLKAGDVFYIPKNCKYRSFWYPEDNGRVSFHSLGFELFPKEECKNYRLQKIDCTAEEMALFDTICDSLTVTPENIGRLYMFAGLVSGRLLTDDSSKEMNISAKAVDYMTTSSDYTIKEVADYCGISESGIYALFKRVYGKTPIEVKHGIVTKKATELLRHTDLSVEEISNRLSFGSSAYFRRIIREQTGKTPREIRKGF